MKQDILQNYKQKQSWCIIEDRAMLTEKKKKEYPAKTTTKKVLFFFLERVSDFLWEQ